MACLNDNSIGPTVHGCRNDFDFTVAFENVVLAIVPSAAFLVLGLHRVLTLSSQQPIVRGVALQWAKLVFAASYSALSLTLVILTHNSSIDSYNAGSSLAAVSLGLVAAVLLAPLSWMEHSRSPRPSILIVAYLVITVLFDVARIRTAWLLAISEEKPTYTHARVGTSMVALKAIMILTESRRKTAWLVWDLKQHSPEETSGVLGLGVYYWLHRLFMSGYRVILSLESLYPLDRALKADIMKDKLAKQLQNTSWRGRKRGLAKLLLRTLAGQLLPPIAPRAVLLAASMCQPLLIQALLGFLQHEDMDKYQNHGYGLIGATALTYGTIALSTALYWYFHERLVIMVRSCLVSAIYEKTTELQLSASADAGAITLMSSDVDRVMAGILDIHEYWANPIQIGLSCWLLERQLGAAFAAPLVVVALSALGAFFLGKLLGPRQRAWMEAIEKRVGVTANAITQMKLVKMSGMTEPVKTYIQKLRLSELKVGGRWRMLLVASATISQVPMMISPVITFAVASKTLDTTSIFVSISYLTLLASPLMVLFQKIPQLLAALTCLDRIQTFLERDIRTEFRDLHRGTESHSTILAEDEEIKMEMIGGKDSPRITIRGGNFGWNEHTDLLNDVDMTIPACRLTAIAGPVASGKTTLCKAILGEVPFSNGSVTVLGCSKIGYCDQQPFLTNASIRDNIVGHGQFDGKRYSAAISATMLDHDFATLPHGDSTVIGSGGIALSGGQRQRLSIARALYLVGTDLLIFDDVLSGLDATTEEHVFRHVFGPEGMLPRRRATVILCTHKPRHLESADHIIRLGDNGSVTEEKPTASSRNSKSEMEPQPGEPETPSATATPKLHASPATAIPAEDGGESRKVGDMKIYSYYLKTAGLIPLLAFFFAGACDGVFTNFPRVWLTFWSDDAARTQEGLERVHSQAYYIGIYGLLQIVGLASFFVAVVLVLGPVIRVSGSVLHQRALDTVVNATLTLFTTTDTGVITNYFSQDMTLIDGELPMALVNLVLDIFGVIVMAAVIASSSPWLALTYPAMIAILWVIQHFYLRTSRQLRLLDLEAKSPLYSHFLDTLRGIATIRAFGWTEANIKHNLVLLDRSQQPKYLLSMVQRWLFLMLNLVVTVIATVLVSLMTQLGASSSLSGASLVTLMTLSQSLADIVRFYAVMETSIGAVTRLRDFVARTETEKTPQEQESVQPEGRWPSEGSIEISGVWASYGDVEQDFALRGIDISVRPGERIALCGRTGSGKSSIILLLLGLLDPVPQQQGAEQGTVSIDGITLSSIDRQKLRQQLITIPQDAVFLPAGSTVAQNLDPAGTATPEQCQAVLTDLGLWEMAQLQGGLNGILTESSLSHGQRQIFSLARGVLKRRTTGGAVLLLDEFTSSVDVDTERTMLAAVEREFSGCTVVMVAHRLDMVAEFCDRVLVINRGSVVEDGDPRLLRRMEDTWFAALLRATS